MTPQQLAQQTHANIALTLGQTTAKMVEAQTAADLLAAETEELREEIAARQVMTDLLIGLLAWCWLAGAF